MTHKWIFFFSLGIFSDNSELADFLRSEVGKNFLLKSKVSFAKVHALEAAWKNSEPKEFKVFVDSFVLSILTNNENKYILIGLNNGYVQKRSLDYDTGFKLLETRSCHLKGVKTLARWMKVFVVTGSYDGSVKVWNEKTWKLLKTFNVNEECVWDCRAFNQYLAACSLDATINLFEYDKTGTDPESIFRPLRTIIDHARMVSSLDLNFSTVLAGRDDGAIVVWSLEGKELNSLKGHTQGVTGLRFLPKSEGALAVSASYDGNLRIWNVMNGYCLAILKGHRDFIRCLAVDEARIVSGDFGGFIRIWDVPMALKEINEYLDQSLKRLRAGKPASPERNPVEILRSRSFYPHRGHVTSIILESTRIYSGSREKTVATLDFWNVKR